MNIVLDYRGWHLGRRIGRAVGFASGTVLVLLGLAASTVAVPTSLAVIGLVLGWLSNESADWLPPEMPASEIVLVWAVACPTAILGIRAGLRLVRGQRRLALFLRRFGYDDATRAVTFAVRTFGASWRLMTLDDEEIAPLGVSAGARTVFGALQRLSTAAIWAGNLPVRIFPFAIWAIVVVVAAQLLTASHWSEVARVDMEVVADIFEWRLPFQRVAPTLPGAFAAFAIGAAIAFGGLMVTFVALLAALPLSALLIFFSSSLESVQEAERSKTLNVQTLADLESAAALTVERTRKVFGPRLVVLRVASSIWQAAVDRLARVSSCVLIDVSEPTENLLWELETLAPRFGARCVIVGHYDRLSGFAAESSSHPADGLERRLRGLLQGQDVIAYTTGRQGMRRFARALRARLFELDDRDAAVGSAGRQEKPLSSGL